METYVRQLEAQGKIRDIVGGSTLNLPQICVIGDQSSGKSSLLKQLTGVDFPVSAGTCTKAAIVVECRKTEEDTCEIAYNSPKYRKEYERCNLFNLKNVILEYQKNLLEDERKNKIGLHGRPSISETEINIKIGGKDQIDITIVDLPGIINQGPGKKETRNLITRYIEPEETLILLVSEAKTDAELISAKELAQACDPHESRTMPVLTKFDNFDSKEAKKRAIQWVMAGKVNELGPHAVIAAANGTEYDALKESKDLEKHKLPSTRCGIRALKDRLPTLYAKLIETNLPGLRDAIIQKKNEAHEVLLDIGRDPAESTYLIKKCQDLMRHQIVKIKEDLSGPMVDLQNEIHEKEADITAQWTSSKFPLNVFEPPFFSGEAAFKNCFSEIIDWWMPFVNGYLEKVEEALLEVIERLNEKNIPKSLLAAVVVAWRNVTHESVHKLRTECNRELQKFSELGTVNHYLTQKFKQEMTISVDFIDKYIESITQYDVRGNLNEIKQSLKTKLEILNEVQGKEFSRKSLHEQQKERLLAAMKAAYTVEKKTITDLIHKATRINILDAVTYWVDVDMFHNEKIKGEAREDISTTRKREKNIQMIEKMNACLREIDNSIDSLDDAPPSKKLKY